MQVAILGGGPSGLYLGYLLKRWSIAEKVDIFERDPAGATFGFGVSLADTALRQLKQADEHSYDQLSEAMTWLSGQRIDHPDESTFIDIASGSGAIGRVDLLRILGKLAATAGVSISYETEIRNIESSFAEYDLVVGADGANSRMREEFSREFGAKLSYLSNRFAWYGVDLPYDTSALTFIRRPEGVFVGHYYRYTDTMSTFVAECDGETWERTGFGKLSDEGRRDSMNAFFREQLSGRKLIDNKSVWRRFQVVANDRWVFDKYALIGDALYTAHYSIGSGTRLAMEDSLALARALQRNPNALSAALTAYERERKPLKRKLMAAAEKSYIWYEKMASKLELPAVEFVHDFMLRTERISDERLRTVAPRFMATYDEHRQRTAR